MDAAELEKEGRVLIIGFIGKLPGQSTGFKILLTKIRTRLEMQKELKINSEWPNINELPFHC